MNKEDLRRIELLTNVRKSEAMLENDLLMLGCYALLENDMSTYEEIQNVLKFIVQAIAGVDDRYITTLD